jgi:hypothetical protein
MPKIFQTPRISVAEESKIIAGVRAGKGPSALSSELRRPCSSIRYTIARLVNQGALKAEEVGRA